MADLVIRWFQKITRLADADYRRLLVLMKAGRVLPPSPEVIRQRRHRGQPVTVTGDSHGENERDIGVTVTHNGHGAIPPHPPAFSSKEVPAFESFWILYPKRVGKGKALEAWNKNGCNNQAEVILTAVKAQMDYLLKDGGQFIPMPATWLNQKRWQDDPPPVTILSQKTSGNAQNMQRVLERLQGDNHHEN